MTQYIVHLYREMKLSYTDIEADTPQAAATIAGGKTTADADNIEDCEGQNLAALVDTAGDEDYSQSVTIEFEGERIRNAAPELLAALEMIVDYAENEAFSLENLKDSPEAEVEAERAWKAVESARDALALAKGAGVIPFPAETDASVEA
jgi:hypothetical protein